MKKLLLLFVPLVVLFGCENDNEEVNFEKTSKKKVKIDYLIKDV